MEVSNLQRVLWEPCGFQEKIYDSSREKPRLKRWELVLSVFLRSFKSQKRVPLFGAITIIIRLLLWTTHPPEGLLSGSISVLERWRSRPTFTFALVLDFQFRLLFTSGLEECTFVTVGFPVQPTDRAFPGDVGTIWGAHTAGFVLLVHSAFFPRSTVHILTRFYQLERGMD